MFTAHCSTKYQFRKGNTRGRLIASWFAQNLTLVIVLLLGSCESSEDQGAEADRFIVPKMTSWDELRSLRPPHMGKCWVHIPVCVLNPWYSGMGDEFIEAYAELGVGDNETACLSRAQYHWEICGSNPFHQVIMTFLPSHPPATASFPDDETVERNLDSRHGFFRIASAMGTDKVRPWCIILCSILISPRMRYFPPALQCPYVTRRSARYTLTITPTTSISLPSAPPRCASTRDSPPPLPPPPPPT